MGSSRRPEPDPLTAQPPATGTLRRTDCHVPVMGPYSVGPAYTSDSAPCAGARESDTMWAAVTTVTEEAP